jgi:hypothetical protein
MTRSLYTSLDIASPQIFGEIPYLVNCMSSPTKGIARNQTMKMSCICHKVVGELAAGLSGGSAADGAPNNVADRLSQ